eukprot:3881836-Prymnesium_polylepis.1
MVSFSILASLKSVFPSVTMCPAQRRTRSQNDSAFKRPIWYGEELAHSQAAHVRLISGVSVYTRAVGFGNGTGTGTGNGNEVRSV